MFINDPNYLDQHFLTDDEIIKLFVNEVDPKLKDIIVEIGPGKGIITKNILPYVKKYTVIEKDERLIPFLKEFNGLNIINDNVLKINIPSCNKLITSLPYSITEPFIYKLINTKFDKLIMICGNNYAKKVINKEDTKLSILTNLFFDINYIKEIKPSSFKPEPKALSALITLKHKDDNLLSYQDKILKELYLYRYMKIKNALKEILIKLNNITQRESKAIINKLNIDNTILDKLFDEISNEEIKHLKEMIYKNFL